MIWIVGHYEQQLGEGITMECYESLGVSVRIPMAWWEFVKKTLKREGKAKNMFMRCILVAHLTNTFSIIPSDLLVSWNV